MEIDGGAACTPTVAQTDTQIVCAAPAKVVTAPSGTSTVVLKVNAVADGANQIITYCACWYLRPAGAQHTGLPCLFDCMPSTFTLFASLLC